MCRYIKWTVFIAGVACLPCDSLFAGAPELVDLAPLVRNYSADEIGTAARVRCLLETPEGYLFAGADRLLIFDGANWRQARIENTTEIRSLCQEGSRIWAGGVNEIGCFEPDDDGNYVYRSVTAQLGDAFFGAVNSIYVAGAELILITERKVAQLPLRGGPPKISDLPNDSRLRSAWVDDALYIEQRFNKETKLWVLKGGVLEPARSLAKIGNQNRLPLGRIRGEWLVGRDLSLQAVDDSTGRERDFYLDKGELARAMMSGSNLCHEDRLYICTRAVGLVVIDADGRFREVGKAQGLGSDGCNAVIASRAGGLWVATDEGVSFVQDSASASWLPLGGQVKSIYGDRHGLYVSHALAGIYLTKDRRVDLPSLPWATWAGVGESLYAASSGKLFVGTVGGTEFREVLGQEQKVGTVVGGRDARGIVYATVTVSPGSRGLMRLDTRTGEKTAIEIPEGLVYYLQDGAGQLWVSTTAGNVMMIDPELRRGTLQFANRKRSRLTLHQGEPIALVDDSGFTTLRGEKVRGSEKVVGSIGTENASGASWVGARSEEWLRVGVLENAEGGLVWHKKNVPGLRRLKNISVLYRSGNDLWIGGESGIIQVDTTALQDPDYSLPIAGELSIRDSATKTARHVPFASKPISLHGDEREFSLRLGTHVWGLLEPPQYESRLLPLEDDWTLHRYGDPITRKNLPTGEHTLQLRVRHLGETGPISVFSVSRPPPWYFSLTGFVCFGVTLAVLFYGAVKLRTRQITARNRELEQKILERTQELAKANAAKSEFLAAMSHEIRNPMNGVIGIVKILQEAKLGAREKYYLATLHRCAEQLRTTVDDVLDFSKIEAGTVTLHPDTFDLAGCIHATATAVNLAGDRLELTSWSGPKPMVTGDQGKFTQILTNYFNNALKYGVPSGATVEVAVVGEGSHRCRVTVSVRNTGPDIPAAEQATLFESFTRGEYAKRGRIGGSGLGLAICKKFAEAMGGGVGVVSSGGVTVFHVSLPFEIAVPRPKLDAEPAIRGLHGRALAVEDEDYNRLVLGSILAKLGYRVDWACDGKTALDLVQHNGYDLILTDLMLPDMEGGTLAREILALCQEPKPPIFAVTAYSTKEKEEECLRAGMTAFIGKPITVEKLEAALQGRSHSQRAGGRPLAGPVRNETPISVQQLAKLGPLPVVLDDFTRKMEEAWSGIDRMLEDRECTPAANASHKLVSAMLLIDATIAADQLRLLERQLRDGGLESEIEKVRSVCRDEVGAVVQALKTELRRRSGINEAPSPT